MIDSNLFLRSKLSGFIIYLSYCMLSFNSKTLLIFLYHFHKITRQATLTKWYDSNNELQFMVSDIWMRKDDKNKNTY